MRGIAAVRVHPCRTEGCPTVQPLKWTDADEIAYRLNEKFPEVEPLFVSFTELHKWITQLEGFDDDPAASTEGLLEAVQMAWLDYYREEH